MKQVNFEVNLPVAIFKEGNTFIAHSSVLDLSTSANTFEKAQKRFVEAVEIFFEELVDMGTLDEVLSNLGWQKIQKRWTPPIQVSQGLQRVTIPLTA